MDDASFLVEARNIGQDGQPNSIDSGNMRPLLSYLPQCPNGSILITTRSQTAALKLVEPRDIIAIEPMSPADALTLFENKVGRHNNGDDAVELAAALEFMPLAIVQAAVYISQRIPRYSVREYLQDFRKSDRKRTSLLNYEGGQLRRDQEAKSSIIITWQISFDHIREIRPSAADLLSLMSFFDRQGIPENLLRSPGEEKDLPRDHKESNDNNSLVENVKYSDSDEDERSEPSMNNGFEDDVLALRNYSFITCNADGTTFEMHGLVQLATRIWLEAHKQQERWKQQFIKNLCAGLPTGEYENWVTCQALFPHVQSAATQQPKEQDSLRDWASILYKSAWYAWRMGRGVEAENMSVQAMKVRKRILGPEDNDTLNSMAMVGLAYELRGQWNAAEELDVQVMETRKKKLGADHPSTLTSMNNLAFALKETGRETEAVKLMEECIRSRKLVLGLNHPNTVSSRTALVAWKAEQTSLSLLQTATKTKSTIQQQVAKPARTWLKPVQAEDQSIDTLFLVRQSHLPHSPLPHPRHWALGGSGVTCVLLIRATLTFGSVAPASGAALLRFRVVMCFFKCILLEDDLPCTYIL